MNIIKIILIYLIFLYILKTITISISIFYQKTDSDKLDKEYKGISGKFIKLIDIEFMRKALDENDKFSNEFRDINPEGLKQIFTHTFVIKAHDNEPTADTKIKDFLENEDAKVLIPLYINNSDDITTNLLNYGDEGLIIMQSTLGEIEKNFFVVLNFLKEKDYPITIIIDTFLIVMIFLCFVIYILYHKLITVIIITLIVLTIIMTIIMNNKSFLQIIIILGLYIAVFGIFGYKLYQQINK